MKNEQEHLMLWQKRNEWQIDDNAQQDWLAMSDMLDTQLPVTNAGISGGASYLSGFKLLTAILVAAAATAVIVYFIFVKGHSTTNSHQKADTAVRGNSQSSNSGTAGSGLSLDADSLSSGTATANGSNSPTPNAGAKYSAALPGNAANINPAGNVDVPKNSGATKGNNTTVPTGRANPPRATHTVNSPASAKNNDKTASAAPPGNANGPGAVNTLKKAVPGKTGNKMAAGATNGNALVSGRYNARRNANALLPNSKKISAANKAKAEHAANAKAKPGSGAMTKANGLIKPGNGAVRNARGSSGGSIAGHGLALPNRAGSTRLGRRHRSNPRSPDRGINGSGKNDQNGKAGLSLRAGNKDGSSTTPAQTAANDTYRDTTMAQVLQPRVSIEPHVSSLSSELIRKTKAKLDSEMAAKKPPVTKPSAASKFDYGILAGVNTSGSFTAKDQNRNFYGSFPVDAFFGVFTTYNFSDKWGLNLQMRGLKPQTVSGTYTHKNDSKKDTNQVLTMTDARKVYSADAALHLVFKPATGLSLKAGPVFSYALKEANGNTAFATGPLKKDSVYYVSVTKLINATTFSKSISIGLSAGAGYQYGRFIFDAAYIRSFGGVTVGSTLGSYTAVNNQFLFSIGFKLNRTK